MKWFDSVGTAGLLTSTIQFRFNSGLFLLCQIITVNSGHSFTVRTIQNFEESSSRARMREGEPSAENGCGVRGKSKDDTKKRKKEPGETR